MRFKKLIIYFVALVIIPIASQAKWVESDKGLYKILELDGAKIISTNYSEYRVITTIQTKSNFYRCREFFKFDVLLADSCWKLESD